MDWQRKVAICRYFRCATSTIGRETIRSDKLGRVRFEMKWNLDILALIAYFQDAYIKVYGSLPGVSGEDERRAA